MSNSKLTKSLSFDTIKAEVSAQAKNFVQAKISLNDVDVTTDGIQIQGQKLPAESGIQKQFLKAIKINPSFISKFGKLLDEQSAANLANVLKTAVQAKSKNGETITVIGDANTKQITNILPANQDFIPSTLSLELFEKTINSAKMPEKLEVVNFTPYPNGGFAINVRHGDTINLRDNREQVVKGEDYNPGFTFKSSPLNGISVESYVERLVCTNGLIAPVKKGDFSIKALEEGAIVKFFQSFMQLAQNNFVSAGLEDKIMKAMKSHASVQEIITARNIIEMNSDLKLETELYNFLPEFTSVTKMLANRGYDYTKCTEAQLKNCPTKYKLWDVVNRVTDFGSHDYGYNTNFANVQTRIGHLLARDVYDTDNVLVM